MKSRSKISFLFRIPPQNLHQTPRTKNQHLQQIHSRNLQMISLLKSDRRPQSIRRRNMKQCGKRTIGRKSSDKQNSRSRPIETAPIYRGVHNMIGVLSLYSAHELQQILCAFGSSVGLICDDIKPSCFCLNHEVTASTVGVRWNRISYCPTCIFSASESTIQHENLKM
jgi:hypothetical protein